MRLNRILSLFLVLFLIVSCNRSTEGTSVIANEPEINRQRESQPDQLKDTSYISSNPGATKSKTTIDNLSQDDSESKKSQFDEAGEENINWWMYGAIISIVINLILIWGLFKTISRNFKLEDGKEYYKKQNLNLQTKIDDLESEKNAAYKERSNIKKKFESQTKIRQRENTNKDGNLYEDEKPVEVSFSLNDASSKSNDLKEKKLLNLYAEKATEENAFSGVSEQKNDHKSIFKLTLEDHNADTAQFEVMDSDFILKMAANSPDTYLYTVCKPENSNQNFAGEIITTQKGIAHKVDGKWHVKDENKAKIKFQ
jgi:hypothetical protein